MGAVSQMGTAEGPAGPSPGGRGGIALTAKSGRREAG